ncbi:MAG: chemotaxis-specific protein-glutamate methyltransferase CheB [Polyangiaceae bacterium]|nr:chemotaxis-specific protein-glutamate methyltransferase CheB [Polyangiaceae bacterium]
MRHIRVLVVDDSAYNRRTLSEVLSMLDGVEVVGKASDGDEALRMVADLQPDLITLDLEMPRMDGFTFLRLLMARRPTPVIVVSGYSAKENVFRALELGAIDFIAKPARTVTSDLGNVAEELRRMVAMVRQLAPASLDPARRPSVRVGSEATGAFAREAAAPRIFGGTEPERIVVVGSSTGGPTALVELFRRLPPSMSASVLVAQHMPERFTRTFAERLDRLGGMRVREASGRHHLEAGVAYVCPGGRCLSVVREGTGFACDVVPPASSDRYYPSVDRLFETAASAVGNRLIAVVLTGMGDDGARGVVAVSEAGGVVLAESAETAVIYGMPGAAARTGRVTKSLPLRPLCDHLAELLT